MGKKKINLNRFVFKLILFLLLLIGLNFWSSAAETGGMPQTPDTDISKLWFCPHHFY